MTLCENNLFIENREFILNILESDNTLFFQSLIQPSFNESIQEAYGTSSDIYTQNIDFHIEEQILYITLYTYDTPCIEFCKRVALKYSINFQLIYYNTSMDFYGKYQIYKYSI